MDSKLVYKLTDSDGITYGNTQWGPGVSHSSTGMGEYLCSPGWIHYYSHPLLAALLNPIHADFRAPKLWEAKAEGKILSDGLKFGCKKLTTIREIPLPEISATQRVAFGILCALAVRNQPDFVLWANRWLTGEDRSRASAQAAETAARLEGAAEAARWGAEAAAAEAARWGAEAAKWGAEAAEAAAEAAAAAWAAKAAVEAAWAAKAAVEAAESPLDLVALAEKALTFN